MAANEHKNLTDVNRHNPKGFETATNDTVLSKNAGTSATGTDGTLVWQSKSLLGTTNYKMQGYIGSGLTNYSYGEDIEDNKSPFQWDLDFGSATATGATLTPKQIFRMGAGHVIPYASSVHRIKGWVSSDGGNVITVAICKITPTAGSTSALTPVVIDEFNATGASSDSKLVAIDETTITAASLAAGDFLFAMIKEASGGSEIFLNLTIETTVY
jgi:hypothetical protein